MYGNALTRAYAHARTRPEPAITPAHALPKTALRPRERNCLPMGTHSRTAVDAHPIENMRCDFSPTRCTRLCAQKSSQSTASKAGVVLVLCGCT
eukprot:5950982-Pleurochrysis_carterae.AAC.5